LIGDAIPLGSRIILVADAYDAMTTDRPYRKGRSSEEALTVLREHAGRQFDTQVVTALEEVLQSL
jgi:HD-GYP domain-containing protein (c-di-GMP phosphodiesterase class II)